MSRLNGLAATDGQPLVVIADDDESILELVRFRLQRSGYRVRAARDGAEALALVRELSPAVVVLDGAMPQLDGLSVIRELRRDVRLSGLPIVMLSARCTDEDVARGLEAGATMYVRKPFSPQDLARQIESLASRV